VSKANTVAFFSFGKRSRRPAQGHESDVPGQTGPGAEAARSAGAEESRAPFHSILGTPPERPIAESGSARRSADGGLVSFGDLAGVAGPDRPGVPPPTGRSAASSGARSIRRGQSLSESDMPQEIEDCAISHANGQTREALRCVEAAIANGRLGPWAMQAWLIRFDLYMQLGLKAAYDVAAERFAQEFERSPPAWVSGEAASRTGPAQPVPIVNVSGHLTAASAGPLVALRKTVERYDGVQLDFARFEGVDAEGCRHLLTAIQSIVRSGKYVRIPDAGPLLEALGEHTVPGDKSKDPAPWLLKIELMQLLDRERDFEEVAIDYAVTFDVSPPSWPDANTPTGRRKTPAGAQDECYVVPGDMVAPADELFSRIRAYAVDRQPLMIDLSRARRIDFVSASQFVKLLSELHARSRVIEIRSANEMVSALLVMMGAGDVATIVPRR